MNITTLLRSFLCCAILLTASVASADNAGIGQVLLARGECTAMDSNKTVRTLVHGNAVHSGDTLRTASGALLQIRFVDGAIVSLRENSEFRLDDYRFNPKQASANASILTLIKGGFRTVTGLVAKLKPSGYQAHTPVAVIGVRGTNYEAVYDKDGLHVACWQGTIDVQNNTGTIGLGQGEPGKFADILNLDTVPKTLPDPPASLGGVTDHLPGGLETAPGTTPGNLLPPPEIPIISPNRG